MPVAPADEQKDPRLPVALSCHVVGHIPCHGSMFLPAKLPLCVTPYCRQGGAFVDLITWRWLHMYGNVSPLLPTKHKSQCGNNGNKK